MHQDVLCQTELGYHMQFPDHSKTVSVTDSAQRDFLECSLHQSTRAPTGWMSWHQAVCLQLHSSVAGSPPVSKSLLGSFHQLIEVMILIITKIAHAHRAPARDLSHPFTAQADESHSTLWSSSQESFPLKSSLLHFSGSSSTTLYRDPFSYKDEQTSNQPTLSSFLAIEAKINVLWPADLSTYVLMRWYSPSPFTHYSVIFAFLWKGVIHCYQMVAISKMGIWTALLLANRHTNLPPAPLDWCGQQNPFSWSFTSWSRRATTLKHLLHCYQAVG